MKAYDYEAVVYEYNIYCIECVPNKIKKEDCYPVFADSEWDHYPICDVCYRIHDYVTLLKTY